MVLGVVPSAQARRSATYAEQGAISSALGIDTGCDDEYVDDEIGTWAAAFPNDGACPGADDLTAVLHFDGTKWTPVVQDRPDLLATQYCPLLGAGFNKVPHAVQSDLRVCAREARPAILCTPVATPIPKSRPRFCESIPNALSDGMHLTHLRWRHWGTSQTTATGIELGFHLPHVHVKVRLLAYRKRRMCLNGDYIYTRLRETGPTWRFTQKIPTCAPYYPGMALPPLS